jgi:hypothetical protein
MNTPSIKTLQTVGVTLTQAKEAKRILRMSRADLEQLPAGSARLAECYHPPNTADLRMSCLDAVMGTYGVEGFQTDKGEWVTYLNAGDPYAPTIVLYRRRYRVACWGDLV